MAKSQKNSHQKEKVVAISRKFKSLVSKKIALSKMRVFGSYARGDATEDSDLDVLIVVDKIDHAHDRLISDCAWEVGFVENIVIVPVIVSVHDLKSSPIRHSLFLKNVFREGIRI